MGLETKKVRKIEAEIQERRENWSLRPTFYRQYRKDFRKPTRKPPSPCCSLRPGKCQGGGTGVFPIWASPIWATKLGELQQLTAVVQVFRMKCAPSGHAGI